MSEGRYNNRRGNDTAYSRNNAKEAGRKAVAEGEAEAIGDGDKTFSPEKRLARPIDGKTEKR